MVCSINDLPCAMFRQCIGVFTVGKTSLSVTFKNKRKVVLVIELGQYWICDADVDI